MSKKYVTGILMLTLCLTMVIPPMLVQKAFDRPVITLAYNYSTPFSKEDMERYVEKAREVLKERGLDVNIKLLGVNIAADEDWKAKLALDLSSGAASDVFRIDGFWISAFASSGYLMPLPVNKWTEWDKFYLSMQSSVKYKGKIYGAMYDSDVRMLYYNKPIFKEAGLPEKWEPKAWEDALATLRIIKQKLPGVTPFASDITVVGGERTTMQNFEMIYLGTLPESRVKQGTWLYDPAKDKWIVNKQGLIDTLQFLKTVYVDEKLGDSVAALEAGSMDFLRRCNGLKDGKIAVVLDGCWNYGENWGSGASASWPNRNKELGWAPMPGNGKKDTPKRTCINGGWAWAINADTKHPDLAFEILKALENPKALSFHNSFTAHVPPRNDVELNEEFARDPAVIDFMERATKKLMPYSTYRPGTPDYPRISLLIQKMVESVCIGEQTPEQAYHWYVSKLKEIVGLDHISIE